MDPRVKNEKIEKYKSFIEDTLKPDLKSVEQNHEKYVCEKQKWNDVKLSIKMLEIHNSANSDNDLVIQRPIMEHETKAVYVKATITNTNDVYVKIGCNCILPMNLEEAKKYADIRIRLVDRQIKHFTDMAIQIKVNIKVTLLALNELMNETKS